MERYDNNLCWFSSNEFTTYHGGLKTNEEDTKDTFQMALPAAAADWPLLVTCDQMENDVDHQKKLNIGADL